MGKIFSLKKKNEENFIIPRKYWKDYTRFHYTMEAMLKLVVTHTKLTEGRFPLNIYITVYLMVWSWCICQPNSEKYQAGLIHGVQNLYNLLPISIKYKSIGTPKKAKCYDDIYVKHVCLFLSCTGLKYVMSPQ